MRNLVQAWLVSCALLGCTSIESAFPHPNKEIVIPLSVYGWEWKGYNDLTYNGQVVLYSCGSGRFAGKCLSTAASVVLDELTKRYKLDMVKAITDYTEKQRSNFNLPHEGKHDER